MCAQETNMQPIYDLDVNMIKHTSYVHVCIESDKHIY